MSKLSYNNVHHSLNQLLWDIISQSKSRQILVTEDVHSYSLPLVAHSSTACSVVTELSCIWSSWLSSSEPL